MSDTRYKKPHVDILICIEMTRERNLGTKKNTMISGIYCRKKKKKNVGYLLQSTSLMNTKKELAVCVRNCEINEKNLIMILLSKLDSSCLSK